MYRGNLYKDFHCLFFHLLAHLYLHTDYHDALFTFNADWISSKSLWVLFSGSFVVLVLTFFCVFYPQMQSDITMVRVRPSTLASWSTLPLPLYPWLSSECLTTCLTGRTMTNMSSLLCSTWCGALWSWRYDPFLNQSQLKWNYIYKLNYQTFSKK